MSVFISYSRKDKDFVDKLSKYLIIEGIKVWRDNFEMVAGQSLGHIRRVIEERSSFMLVVLSRNSIESKWCQIELDLGLKLEREMGEIFLIPILIEDCEIPKDVENKVYADFRNSFEEGLGELIMPLSRLYSKYGGRVEAKGSPYYVDYSIDVGEGKIDGRFYTTIDVVQFHKERPFSLLIQVFIKGDEAASRQWKSQRSKGDIFLMPTKFINHLNDDPDFNKLQIRFKEERTYRNHFLIHDGDFDFQVEIIGRLLGNNNTFDVLFDLGSIIKGIAERL